MASKRRLRRRCVTKVAYTSLHKATDVAAALRRKYPGERIGAYKCKMCGMFHVGHTPKNKLGKPASVTHRRFL